MLYIIRKMDSNIVFNDDLFISIQRIERNKLLNESDKYMLCDYPITSNNLLLIQQYRQDLRQYMDNTYFTSNIIFPDFPQLPF